MIRRSALALGALVAALALSSCSTLSTNNDTASVGDTELSRDRFETYLGDLLAVGAVAERDQIAGDDARSQLSLWIGDQLTIQFLADKGVAVTDADRQTISSQLDAELADRGVTISDSTRAIVVDGAAARTVFQQQFAPGDLGAFAASVDVQVDSRYGYWDGETGAVVAFQ